MDASDHTPILIILFGPPAVGKMAVGQELERVTGFRLFHNHQVIDLLTGFFPFDSSSYDRLHRYWPARSER